MTWFGCPSPTWTSGNASLWSGPPLAFLVGPMGPRRWDHGVVALLHAPPGPLIREAARQCFWQLPMVFLRHLAAKRHVDIPAHADLSQCLTALIVAILGPYDEGLPNILNRRFSRLPWGSEELLHDANVVELYHGGGKGIAGVWLCCSGSMSCPLKVFADSPAFDLS